MQFLDVRTDYAFKKMFGSDTSVETLKSFLNALIYHDRPHNLDHIIQQALENANEANLNREELEAQYKRKEFISIQRLALMKAYRNGTPTNIIGSFVDMSEEEVIDFLRTIDDL